MKHRTSNIGGIAAAIAVSFTLLGSALVGLAASDTWNQPGGSHSWNSGANWLSGTQYPDGAGDVAYFTNNITSSQVVTISPAVTVGGIVLGDPDSSHIFSIGTAGQTLNMDNGVSAITINSLTTFNQILANVTATGANKDLIVNVDGSELDFGDSGVGPTLTIHDLTKNGPGILFMWNNNTGFTGSNITINAGTVYLDSMALPTNGVVSLGSGTVLSVGGGRVQDLAEVRGVGEFRNGGNRFVIGSPNADYSSISYGGLIVTNGGKIRPGDTNAIGQIGTLHMGNPSASAAPVFEVGSEFYFDIASYSSFDQIDAPRTFTLVNGGDTYLNFLGAFKPTNGATFNLFIDTSSYGYQHQNGGKIFDNIRNTSTGLTNFFYADDGFTAALGGNPLLTGLGNDDYEDVGGLGTPFITFTYFIPEPSAIVLLGFGTVLLLRRQS